MRRLNLDLKAEHPGFNSNEIANLEVPRALSQPRLFALDALGDGGWSKAFRLEGYAPRSPRRPEGLQQTLFAYHEAWG